MRKKNPPRSAKAEEKAKTNMLAKIKFSFDSNGNSVNFCETWDAELCRDFMSREILRAVLPKRQETGSTRPSCRSAVRF